MATSRSISLGATGLHLQDLALYLFRQANSASTPTLQFRSLGTWISGGTYAVGDYVYSAAVWYKNLTGVNTSTAPASDATNWVAATFPYWLTELGETYYSVGGLPDPQPSEDYSLGVALTGSPAAILLTYDYGWTKPVDLPSLIANTPGGFRFDQVPMAIKHGSTTPPAFAHIWGLTADPTGATVAFALTPLGGGSAIAGMGGVARVTFVDSYGAPPLWHMMIEFDWAPGDLDADNVLTGIYVGTFTVTLPSAGGTVISPNDQGRVAIS